MLNFCTRQAPFAVIRLCKQCCKERNVCKERIVQTSTDREILGVIPRSNCKDFDNTKRRQKCQEFKRKNESLSSDPKATTDAVQCSHHRITPPSVAFKLFCSVSPSISALGNSFVYEGSAVGDQVMIDRLSLKSVSV